MHRSCLAAAATVLGLLLVLGLLFYQSQREDVPRKNDRILRAELSPDRRLRAYLVMREGDSLSSDVLKLFVGSAAEPWYDGEIVMAGRRFSTIGTPKWLSRDWLCMVASSNGIEEQKTTVEAGGARVRIQIAPTIEACIAARDREKG